MTQRGGACLFIALLASIGCGEAKNPVEDVVELMEKLEKKISDESKNEAAAYDKYACFCKDQADEKFYSITKKTERINELAAAIKAAIASIEENTLMQNEAMKQRTHLNGEYKTTEDKSNKDHAEHQQMHDDITNGLIQLDDAIKSIESAADATNDDMLIEVNAKVRKIMEESDPHAYENKGGKTLETLEKIKVKFTKRLLTIEDWESDRQHAVDMEQQARSFEINSQSKMITKCQNTIGEKSSKKSEDEQEKLALENDRADDNEFLAKVTEECEDKASKWDARSMRRTGELEALSKALLILKGDATSKYGSNKLALRQTKKSLSFLQVASVTDSKAAMQAKAKAAVMAGLRKQASALKSSQLWAFAMMLRDSPFDSVKLMIKDLIDKIDAEQESENEEIEDCKKDIEEATRKRSKNQGRMEEEEAKIIELGSDISFLGTEIDELGVEISELYKALKEATAIREKESSQNKVTLEDATAGKNSMDKAIGVLKDFYDAGFEGGFVQTGSKLRREPETGAPDAGGFLGDDAGADPAASAGILPLLQTILGDYESTMETVTEDEDEASTAFGEFKGQTDGDIQSKKDMLDDSKAKKKQAEDDTEQAKDDFAEWTSQKAEAVHELSILEPRCLGLGASAEERKKRREEEKTALQDAITILESMAPAEAPEPSKEEEEFLQRSAEAKLRR